MAVCETVVAIGPSNPNLRILPYTDIIQIN